MMSTVGTRVEIDADTRAPPVLEHIRGRQAPPVCFEAAVHLQKRQSLDILLRCALVAHEDFRCGAQISVSIGGTSDMKAGPGD